MITKTLLLAIVALGLAASAASAGEFGAFTGSGPGGPIAMSWDPADGIYNATYLGSVDPVTGVVGSSGYLYSSNSFSPGEWDNPTGYTLIHPSMWWRDVNVGLYAWGFNGGLPFEDYSSNPIIPTRYIYAPVRPEDFGDGGFPFAGEDFGSGEIPTVSSQATAAAASTTASLMPATQVTPEPATMAFFCVTGVALLKRRSR